MVGSEDHGTTDSSPDGNNNNIESISGAGDRCRPEVYVIEIDKSNKLEELAIDLGLKEIPSYQIYRYGKLVKTTTTSTSPSGDSAVSADAIIDALKSVSGAATVVDTNDQAASAVAVLEEKQQQPSTIGGSGGGGSCCALPPLSSTIPAVACCPV
jgi:hypothetical protein